jgi:DNA mismatch repair protein MutS2
MPTKMPTPISSDGTRVVDLLHHVPLLRIDVESTDLAIVIAFSGGTSGGLFQEALEKAAVAPSTWDPKAYAGDLFLSRFVATCLQVDIRGRRPAMVMAHLQKTVGAPPKDMRSVHQRRQILSELLTSSNLRDAFEAIYQSLGRLRALLEGTGSTGTWDANRRQLDILELFKDLIERMLAFSSANSELRRLFLFATRIRATEAFAALSDLLRYDERLATVSFKMGIGADGRVRRLELQSVEESSENQFVASPLRRWLARLELFARGFRFGEGEVMARLLDAVFEGVRAEFTALVQLLGDLEFYLGALGFVDRARGADLAVCLPEISDSGGQRQLLGLFNPLLLGHGMAPVPCDIVIDRVTATTLITGPNSGGKTRLLQSLALTQLLAQSGLFVPAREARLSLVPALVVSLIQDSEADQTEGRLGMELMRIRALFERLPPGAMVILDELCSGTNPSEGEEIFELVIRMLNKLSPQAFITTHFLGFAARLAAEGKIPHLRFLQVVLGAAQEPTYQFAEGVATTSLASQAAARLGVTGDQLLELIEKNLRLCGEPNP